MKRLAALVILLALVTLGVGAACKRESAAPAGPASASASPPPVASAPAPSATTSASSAPGNDNASASWKRPFLWSIAPKGAGKTSYLLGTIHVPDPRLDPMPASVTKALDAADVAVTEIPMDPGTQLRMAPMLVMPNGQTLSKVLPPALHARLEQRFDAQGLPFAPFDRFKPWAVATQLELLDKMALFATRQPLDVQIATNASQAGKQTDALETLEEQVGVFDGLTQDEQVRLLQQTLDELDKQKDAGRDPIEELMTPFLAGDDATMRDVMRQAFDPKNALDQKMLKRLFTDRNASMSERIAQRLGSNSGKSYLFAVGAGHTVGDDGIVARLGAKGWVLTRM